MRKIEHFSLSRHEDSRERKWFPRCDNRSFLALSTSYFFFEVQRNYKKNVDCLKEVFEVIFLVFGPGRDDILIFGISSISFPPLVSPLQEQNHKQAFEFTSTVFRTYIIVLFFLFLSSELAICVYHEAHEQQLVNLSGIYS